MVGDTSFGGLVIRNALASGPDGNLWISMGLNHGCNPEVMRVTPSGTYTVLELPITCDTMAGPATNISGFVAGPDGNLWYARGSAVGKIVLQ
jgi:streptogramin lyase